MTMSVGAVAEIRFSDVASFVSLSFLPERPRTQQASTSSSRSAGRSSPAPQRPSTSLCSLLLGGSGRSSAGASAGRSGVKRVGGQEGELPPLLAGKVGRMKAQLNLLQAEHTVQQKEVRRLEVSLSATELYERRAAERAARAREQHSHHARRAAEVEQQMQRLREDLAVIKAGGVLTRPAAEQDLLSPSSGSSPSLRRAASAAEFRAAVAAPQVVGSPSSDHKAAPEDAAAPVQPESRGAAPASAPEGTPHRRSSQATPEAADESVSALGRRRALLVTVDTASSRDPSSRGSSRAVESRDGELARADGEAFVTSQWGFARGPPSSPDDSPHSGGIIAASIAVPTAAEMRAAKGARVSVDETAVPQMTLKVVTEEPVHSSALELQLAAAAQREAQEAALAVAESEAVQYIRSLNKLPGEWAGNERDMVAHLRRKAVRKEMVKKAGAPRSAFKVMDMNGNGFVSSQEFEDGISRIGVNWQRLTGLIRIRDLFKLFDQDHDSVLSFAELFPDEAERERQGLVRVPTPDFCKRYLRSREHRARPPEWQPGGAEEELTRLLENVQRHEQANVRRKWMEATMKRLKSRGKGDARCRELVALHLPRGTGPGDLQGVPTFTEGDLRHVRQKYTDQINTPIRETTKTMGDLRDLRREQKRIFERLYSVTEAEHARARAEAATAQFSAFFTKVPTTTGKDGDEPLSPASREIRTWLDIARDAGMTVELVEEIFMEFMKFANRDKDINLKAFGRVLKGLCPTRTLADNDLEAWWVQAVRLKKKPGSVQEDTNPRKAVLPFDAFTIWYGSSELRPT